MKAGARRIPFSIVAVVPSDSDYQGQPEQTREIAATWWASMDALSDSERPEGDGLSHNVTYQCRGQYVPGVEPQHRLLTRDGRRLTIVEAVDPDGRRRELHCRAIEQV